MTNTCELYLECRQISDKRARRTEVCVEGLEEESSPQALTGIPAWILIKGHSVMRTVMVSATLGPFQPAEKI